MSSKAVSNTKDNECDECERAFYSRRGLKIHYAHCHEGSMAQSKYECEYCGDVFFRCSSQVHSERVYCSMKCWREWQFKHRSSTISSRGSGRRFEYYGRNWPMQREKALDRDGYECVVCGISNEEYVKNHYRELSVHHIIPFREFGLENHREANDLDNLVTVCEPCHNKCEGWGLVPDGVVKSG